MRESIFTREWQDSWRYHYPSCHFQKIPDMPKTSGARFLPQKPYDCYAALDGRFYAMELKLHTSLTAFPFGNVTDWQIDNLKEASKNGVHALLVVNYRVQKVTEKQKKKFGFSQNQNRFDYVFVFDIKDFVRLDQEMGSKSLPFEIIFEQVRPVISKTRINKKVIWDIPKLINP